MTPPSLESRWLTGSLLRYLQFALPGLAGAIGPVPAPPATLPMLICQESRRSWQPLLGGRVSATSNQRGQLLVVDHAALVYAATVQDALAQWDRIAAVLSTGTLPWISEAEADEPVWEGSLRVSCGPAQAAASDPPQPRGPYAIVHGLLTVEGVVAWIEGGV